MVERWLDDVRRNAICKLREDKCGSKKLGDAVDTVMELYDTRRAGGLLAMEEAAEAAVSDFLKHLILLTAKEVSPKGIIEIATNEYWMNEPEGGEAMVNYLHLRGMIGIQRLESKELLMEVLLSLMPAKQRKEYERLMGKRKEEQERLHKKEIREKFSALCPTFKQKEVQDVIRLLENKIKELPDQCLQRLVRDVDCRDLAGCVYAFEQGTRTRVLENLSTRYRDVVEEEGVKRAFSDEEKLFASVNKVMDIMERLRENGELLC